MYFYYLQHYHKNTDAENVEQTWKENARKWTPMSLRRSPH